MRRIVNSCILLCIIFLSACTASSPPAVPTSAPTAAVSVPTTASPAPTSAPKPVEYQPIPGGPILLREGMTLRRIITPEGGSIRLALNPANNTLYLLNPFTGLFRLDLGSPALLTKVADVKEIFKQDVVPSGMAFAPDGTLYLVANRNVSNRTQAVIWRGREVATGNPTWELVMRTEAYPRSNTPFDHLFNGIIISPDGQWIYVNSGSRTDHGEIQAYSSMFPNTREVPLTAKIFRLPTSAISVTLTNDLDTLNAGGYIYADGTRNAYDFAFAPNGDLFAVDNGPDADYPDELNWIREGQHYGFPWRFGDQDNPQQFPDYDSSTDKRLSKDFTAVNGGFYRNDPTYPPAPTTFTAPIINRGPAATQYLDDTGTLRDAASEGGVLHTFTPHRSPLGIVFATDPALPDDLRPTDTTFSAFVLSWGAAGGILTDKGQDLLFLRLTKQGDTYEATTTQIARDFKNPIDAVMIGTTLYILEYGPNGAVWALEL